MAVKPDSDDDNLIAAAEAAASWARARRAKWTSKPLEVPAAPPPDELWEFEFEPQPPPRSQPEPPAQAQPPTHPPPTPVTSAPPPRRAPPVAPPPLTIEPISASVHETAAAPNRAPAPVAPPRPRAAGTGNVPIPKWVPGVGIAAALIIIAVVVAPYALNSLSSDRPAAKPAAVERRAEPPVAARKATGTLSITSTPAGAQVIVDGRLRGASPLELTDLSPGRHEIALTGDAGTVHRTVSVVANKTVTLDEAIFSGWIAVYSPFEITVAEGARVLRPDDRGQVMLPPGTHMLRFVNKTLGYDESRQVDVRPGEGTPIRVTPQPSTITVTANEPAEVWIDGNRVGEVPLNGVGLTLGTHEVVVRRAAGGTERRFTVSIGVAPYQLHVDFSQPGA